jgi:hypothetical protein
MIHKTSLSTFVLSLIATAACVAACGGSTASGGAPSGETADSGTPTTGGGGTTTKDAGTTAPVDNGAPSETYPAPHPAAPQLQNLGGAVMSAPHIIPVFFPNDPNEADLLAFTKAFPTSSFFAANTAEYGVAAGNTAEAVDITEAPAKSLDDTAIQTWIGAQIDAKTPGFDGTIDSNTLFVLYYPQTTTISLSSGGGQNATSCQSFGGYHDSFTHGGIDIAYAVVPRCPGFAGKGMSVVDVTTGSASHEILEAATDPHPQTLPAYGQPDDAHLFWEFLLGGGENGDMCAQFPDSFVKDPGVGFTVQRSWSNKAAAAGRNPCVPAPAGEVYFNSAVKLPDVFDFGQGFKSPAITLPVGGSKTVEVDLFSEAKTSGPWTVEAFDESSFGGGPSSLDFAWDRTTGVNGEKLHLTVTLNSKPQQGAAGFFIVSKLGNQEHMWLGLVAAK